MDVEPYVWPIASEFLGRETDLEQLDAWWAADDREPLAMLGRRRVGKSWLVRKFAHGRPAVILVAEDLPPGAQLSRFSRQLEPLLGVAPALPDVPTLFRVLYRAAHQQRLLVVIDEFPYLLGATAAERERTLTSVQAVLEEERDESKLKLLVCGSHVAVMESLFSERNPLHGRLRRFEVRPLSFGESAPFLSELAAVEAFERYAITGGVPRYLLALNGPSLRDSLCAGVLDRNAPLWGEGRAIVDQELREPRVYFGVLEQLAGGAKGLNEVAQALGMGTSPLSQYLRNLEDLRLVSRSMPIGSKPGARGGQWQIDDEFLRFWFRFVFPFQADLEAGLSPMDLFDGEVSIGLADLVAQRFEAWCRTWTREHLGVVAPQVGRWWGNALNEHRRSGVRSSEEIDVVGVRRGAVTVVGEAKWTRAPMSVHVLDDLERFKLPAVRQAGLRVSSDLRIVLWSKAGCSPALVERAAADERITLVDVDLALAGPGGAVALDR